LDPINYIQPCKSFLSGANYGNVQGPIPLV